MGLGGNNWDNIVLMACPRSRGKAGEVSITHMLSLEEDQLVSVAAQRWLAWCHTEPRLAVCQAAQLPQWRGQASPEQVNELLRGLARLAAFDGGDDPDAARLLAWLVLPAVLRVRRELRSLPGEVDAIMAAQLWLEVRSLPWQRPFWVAAKIASRVRDATFAECGVVTPRRRHIAVVSVGEGMDNLPSPVTVEPDDPAVLLSEVLAWACERQLISAEDRLLLVSLVTTARTLEDNADQHGRTGSVAGLGGREVSELVGRQLGVCGRTVRRRAKRCLDSLTAAAPALLREVVVG